MNLGIETEESLREVSQKIKNFIEPKIYPQINKVVLDGKDCIHVRFEGNQVPYFAYGIAKIRVADEDLTMSPEQITELLLSSGREGNRWESLVSNKTTDDVDAAGVEYEFKKMKSGFVVCFYRSGEKADKKLIKADKRPIRDVRKERIIEYVKNMEL